MEPLTPQVVLAIGAHPDDMDFGAAGTLAHFATTGADIHYLQLTDGGSGSSDPNASCKKLAQTRRAEQETACDHIGGKSVTYLDYRDGCLENSMELKTDIVKVIRKLKPDVVITMDPTVVYAAERGIINHPDHRAAGQATLDAVYPLARDHLSLPKLYKAGYLPHKVTTLLLINFNSANYYVDVTAVMDKKLAAIEAHASQISDVAAARHTFSKLAAEYGRDAGCEYAEAFVRIDIDP